MHLHPIVSSNLQLVGYEPTTKYLAVQFKSGDIYGYRDVPQQIYDDLLAAPSAGQYFSRFIRQTYVWEKNPEILVTAVHEYEIRITTVESLPVLHGEP